MTFRSKILMNNAAFEGCTLFELARILRELAEKIENDPSGDCGPIMDINGNKVGEWSIR